MRPTPSQPCVETTMLNQAPAAAWSLRANLWPYHLPQVGTPPLSEDDVTRTPFAPIYPFAPISGLDSENLFSGAPLANSAVDSSLNLMAMVAPQMSGMSSLAAETFNLTPGTPLPTWLPAAVFGLKAADSLRAADDSASPERDDIAASPSNPFRATPKQSQDALTDG